MINLLDFVLTKLLMLVIATCIPLSLLAETETKDRGIAFSDPTHVEEFPEQWIKQPIRYKKLPENTDLAITLDQQLYPALVPFIKQYARQHHLRIAVSEGTCGISAGALLDKAVDIGGFCCFLV